MTVPRPHLGRARLAGDAPASVLPGLRLVGLGMALAWAVHAALPPVSPLVAAVALGTAAANLGLVGPGAGPGLQLAAKRGLRAGIVVLGCRLAVGDVLGMGAGWLVAVLAVVGATFFGTRWLSRWLGLPAGLGLLLATGFSICGVSAIAAVESAADVDEDDVALAVVLVTLCGTLSIVVLPLLGRGLGLDGPVFGAWAGASVHDVAQVVATASTAGPAALTTAVTVKLSRVALLAPLVAAVTLSSGRSPAERPGVPLFVVGFLAAVLLRSSGLLADGVVDLARHADGLLLSAAMVALGAGVQLRRLARLGLRPVLVAALASLLVTGVSLGAVRLAL